VGCRGTGRLQDTGGAGGVLLVGEKFYINPVREAFL